MILTQIEAGRPLLLDELRTKSGYGDANKILKRVRPILQKYVNYPRKRGDGYSVSIRKMPTK